MKNSLSAQTLIVTFGKSSEKIVLLLLSIILSRYLSVSDYGAYKQTLLVFSTLVVIFTIGIPNSISYFIPQLSEKKQKTLILQTYFILTILGFIVSLLMFFGADLIAKSFHNEKLALFLKWLSLYPLFFLPTQSYTNLFISLERAKLTGLLSLSFGVIKFILVLSVILLGLPIQYIFISLVLFSILQFIIVLAIVFNLFRHIKTCWDILLLKEQLFFSFPIGISCMIGIIIKKMDQIMISTFFTPKEYAIYVNGAIEIPFIMIVSASAMAVLMPFLVKSYKSGDIDSFVSKWSNSVLKVSIIVFPITIFFMFFAQEVMVSLFSKKYFDSYYVFRIYLIAQIVRITVYGNIFLVIGKSKLIFKYTLIALFLNLVLNFTFIHIFGFIGPAIATVFSIIVLAFMQLKKISSIIKVKLSDLWHWRKLLLLLISVIIIAAISSLSKILNFNDIITLIIGSITFSMLYYYLINVLFIDVLPQNLRWRKL